MTEECFKAAYKRNSQRLFLIALSFTKSKSEAEDILQNVFLKLWKSEKSFSDDEHIDKWLTVVCVNESKNLIKSFFKRSVVPLNEADGQLAFERENDYELFSAVMSLSQKERTVVHLFYYEELSVREISSLLKISESAVKKRLSRARKNIKFALGDEQEDEQN